MPHHQQSPATGYFEAVGGKRVSNGVGIKPIAFIFDADLETIVIDTERDAELFLTVAAVAMLDGVDHRFIKGLQHIQHIALRITSFTQAGSYMISNAVGSTGIALDDEAFRQ